jgi:hypothetical protein
MPVQSLRTTSSANCPALANWGRINKTPTRRFPGLPKYEKAKPFTMRFIRNADSGIETGLEFSFAKSGPGPIHPGIARKGRQLCACRYC